jgi:ABC-type transport system involved in multi-copper enzyme maturation permease subunit
MNDSNTNSIAYVRKFAFRPFEGIRRGRLYRLWSVSWHWCVHQWERSRAVKVLVAILLFTFVFMNMILLLTKDLMLMADPTLTTNDLLEDNILTMVRGIVTFGMVFTTDNGDANGSGMTMNVGGTSIFILILVVLVGSGLISDDISNQTNEIYYSKLEKYEYVLGKFGAFFIFGNIVLTLPYIIEFFLLAVGLGDIDLLTALPVLVQVILFTELITITYSSLVLAFSSITNRRLYAGLSSFMFLFVIDMIVQSLVITGDELGPIILFDVLTVLLLTSYLLTGTTTVEYQSLREPFVLNLADGVGIESWMVLGALGIFILLGFLIVAVQVFWRHSK